MGSNLTACIPEQAAKKLGIPTQDDYRREECRMLVATLNQGSILLKNRAENLDNQIGRIGIEIRKKYKEGDRKGAMDLYSQKGNLEKHRTKTTSTITTLMDRISDLQDAEFNGELYKVMKKCGVAMEKSTKGVSVEEVEDLLDNLKETREDTHTIGKALTTPLKTVEEEDAELDAEYMGPPTMGGSAVSVDALEGVADDIISSERAKTQLEKDLEAFILETSESYSSTKGKEAVEEPPPDENKARISPLPHITHLQRATQSPPPPLSDIHYPAIPGRRLLPPSYRGVPMRGRGVPMRGRHNDTKILIHS
jgi:hypothetical protein